MEVLTVLDLVATLDLSTVLMTVAIVVQWNWIALHLLVVMADSAAVVTHSVVKR